MIETFLGGVLFLTETLLSNSVFCFGGSTIDSESVGTNERQKTFATIMYLLPNLFLFTELKHIVYELINDLFYLSLILIRV